MLANQHRLRKKSEIERVLRFGRGVSNERFGLKLAKNDLGVTRFAFAVGLKVSKSAVKRNRLRRQMREVVRLNLAKIRPNFDVLVMTRQPSLELNFAQISQEFARMFKRVGLL